jgi:hypothetical protein
MSTAALPSAPHRRVAVVVVGVLVALPAGALLLAGGVGL